MVKVVDNFMHTSSLSRLGPLLVKRTKAAGKFKVNEESDSQNEEQVDITQVQNKPLIQRLSLLKLKNLSNPKELEMVSYSEDLLLQLQGLQCQVLLGEVSYEELEALDKTFKRLPESLPAMSQELQDIVNNIQVRVAVELAKFQTKSS